MFYMGKQAQKAASNAVKLGSAPEPSDRASELSRRQRTTSTDFSTNFVHRASTKSADGGHAVPACCVKSASPCECW